jgi:hypothetical protein
MSTPAFSPSNSFMSGYNGERLTSITGTLVLDGSHGATAGDIPASLFRLSTITQVTGGLNVEGTQAVWFQPAPGGASLLSLNSSGAPANAAADSYTITVTGN